MNRTFAITMFRAALLLVAITFAAPLLAQNQPGDRRPAAQARTGQAVDSFQAQIETLRIRVATLTEEFNLTPDQREAIRLIMDDALAQLPPILFQMAANRQALTNLAVGGDADAPRVEQIATAQGDLFAALAGLRVDALIEIRGVLTEDQLGLLTELRATMRAAAQRLGARAGGPRAALRGDRRAMLRGNFGAVDRLTALAESLGITPEQRAEIRAIVEAAIPQVLDIAADLAANRQTLASLIRQPAPEGAEIQALLDAQGELFAELVLIGFDTRVDARALLTDEQLVLLESLRADFRQRLVDLFGAG